MSSLPRPADGLLRLFLLVTTVVLPLYLFLVELDAARYWVFDLNSLLGMRTAINVLAICAALIALVLLLFSNRSPRVDELAYYGLVFVAMFAFVTGLFLVPLALLEVLSAVMGDTFSPERMAWTLWPIGAGVLFLRFGVKHPRPPQPRLPAFFATMAAPFLLAACFQYSAWFLEKHCWQAVRSGGPDYLDDVARCRPAAWFMSFDPLVMQYLRVTGNMKVGPVPSEMPPGDDPMAHRLAAAYRMLEGEDLEQAAIERYAILVNDHGHFRDPGE